MSKWRVEKFTVWRTTSPWRVVNQYGVIADYFPTHRMAIGHADRMARTVQVVLPRELPTTLNHNNLMWGIYGLDIQDSLDGQEVGFNPPDLKPLALALLAHSRRNA